MTGLDARRAVQIITRRADGRWLGSGYLVRSDMVITAQHVVTGAAGITVRLIEGPGEVREVDGDVAWAEVSVDLAVVRLAVAVREVPPVRFGRLAGPAACEAVGYPRFKHRDEHATAGTASPTVFRDSHHARGTCTPLSNQREGTLEISVTAPSPSPDQGRSLWEGMSGAAVFADGSLIGVVTDNYELEGPGLLTARTVEKWLGLPAAQLDTLRDLVGMPQADQLAGVAEETAGAPLRRELPRDTAAFTGRTAELELLIGSLDSATDPSQGGVLAIHAVDGLAGVGKTTFAVHAAHHLASRFPDGQVFLPLSAHTPGVTPLSAEDALAQLLLGDGLPPANLPDGLPTREHLWRSRTAGRRMLLVLDDAANADQVRPLLPAAPETLVLVTSRRRLTGLDDAIPISLDILTPGDAARLLLRIANRPGLGSDDPHVARLVQLCGFLPLALRITAARLLHHPSWNPADLVCEFEAFGNRLGVLRGQNQSVASMLDLSYRDLTAPQQFLFRMLGAHPGTEYEPAATAAMLGTDLMRGRELLADLEEHRLIDETAAAHDRYRMHDLVREHAGRLAAAAPDETGPPLIRLLDHYASFWGPGALERDSAVQEQMLPWLRAERENVLACIEYAHRQERDADAVRLTHLITHLLMIDGPRAIAVDLNVRAAESALRTSDKAARARALYDLGSALNRADDRFDRAEVLQRAAELYESIGDSAGQARVLTDIGHMRWMRGDYAGAEECHSAALSIFTALGNLDGQARLRTDRGEVRRMTGDFAGALEDQRAALAIFRRLGIRFGQGRALTMLGEVRYLLADFAGSARDLADALVIFEELESEFEKAEIRVYRADLRAAQGDLAGALEDIERALAIFRHRNPGRSKPWAWPMGHLARLTAQAGDTQRALELFRETVELAREQEQPDDEAIALEGTGECLKTLGGTAEAETYLAQALAIYQKLGMRPEIKRVTARLAELRGTE